MPFSFIEIEQQKSRVIAFLFVFIILFYFLTAFLILLIFENYFFRYGSQGQGFILPSYQHILTVFLLASFAAILHWTISTSNLIEKMSLAVGAESLDVKDTYHQYLKNIVEEVSVAIGGRPLEPLVIPSASMNAFALEDFNKRAVIGVTEGLLARLNRSQLEAVVGHEAGHIVSGDCLSTTVACSLSEIYETLLSKIQIGLKDSRGRGTGPLIFIYLVVGVMNFMSKLLRAFISRQREYRADALSVRLTRDPLSLAEALTLISTKWRGEGMPHAKMESIFIVNPTSSPLDESHGFFSDVFSTHPPVQSRVSILADMAHLDEETIEENLKNFQRVSPVAAAEEDVQPSPLLPSRWFAFLNETWAGPFALGELKTNENFKPDTWVRAEDQTATKHAYEEEGLIDFFRAQEGNTGELDCPHCRTPLKEISYEGVPLVKCSYCEGIFVEEDKITRLFIRTDKSFSDETKRLAEVAMKEKDALVAGQRKMNLGNTLILDCPKCHQKMRRQFFVYSYPVEIDRCISCDGIWFDRQELEILQYIYEHKEKFFDGESF